MLETVGQHDDEDPRRTHGAGTDEAGSAPAFSAPMPRNARTDPGRPIHAAESDPSDHGYVQFDLATLGDPVTDAMAFEHAWWRFEAHFSPRLHSYFQQEVPAPDERDDLIQHILIKATLHIRSVQSVGVLWNWLRKIGHNRLTDLRRSAKSNARHIELLTADLMEEEQGAPRAQATDPRLDPFAREGELGRRIAALSAMDRQLLDLVADKVPHDEIAAQLGLASADASRQKWSRLRRKLRAS